MQREYFNILIKLANKAAKKNEVPVSALLVKNNKIISKAYNKREKTNFIGNHCEMLVIKKSSRKLKTWHLESCDLYVTLKPCKMCEAAIKQARIQNVYYLLDKENIKKEYDKTNIERANISTIELNYKNLLNNFFQKIRDKNKHI